MADPIETVRAVLAAAAPVTAIVGTRISPLYRAQTLALPAITLQGVSRVPFNSLRGYSNLDNSRVQVEAWAETYAAARALADAARAALEAAGHLLDLETPPDFDDQPAATPQAFRITQDFQVWT